MQNEVLGTLPSPLQDNSRQMHGAVHCDTPATLPWHQQKPSQNWSASSQSQRASTLKACTCPSALRSKHLSSSAGLCFHNSSSIKQRAMKAVKKQACGKSDGNTAHLPHLQNKAKRKSTESNNIQNCSLSASDQHPNPSQAFVLLICCLTSNWKVLLITQNHF